VRRAWWPVWERGRIRGGEIPGLAEALAERGVVRTRKITEEPFVLPGGGSVLATEIPPGTAGFADLARNAEPMEIGGGTVLVASLLDLLRIADALISEPAPKREDPDEHPYLLEQRQRKWSRRQSSAHCDALALRAVLDVRAAKQAAWDGEYVSAAPGPDFGPED